MKIKWLPLIVNQHSLLQNHSLWRHTTLFPARRLEERLGRRLKPRPQPKGVGKKGSVFLSHPLPPPLHRVRLPLRLTVNHKVISALHFYAVSRIVLCTSKLFDWLNQSCNNFLTNQEKSSPKLVKPVVTWRVRFPVHEFTWKFWIFLV